MNKLLKRLGVVTLFIALFIGSVKLYGLDTPTGMTGTVSTTYPYTSIVYTWTVMDSLNQANADSLVLMDPTDSTIVATMDSVTQITYTLTGLIPNKAYAYSIAPDSAGEAWGISTPDTTNTTALTFAISAGAQPNTFVNFTLTDMLDTTAVAADSMCIVSSADSTISYDFTSLGRELTSGTVDGLIPSTTYGWMIAARSGALTGTHVLSNADTITTGLIDIDWLPWRPAIYDMQMRKATSYQPSRVDTTYINLYAEADAESTVVYELGSYTNIFGWAVGDSCNFTILVYTGYSGNDAVPANKLEMALVDSLNVSAAGQFSLGNIEPNGLQSHMYAIFRGDADCGWTTIYPRIGRQNVIR